MDLLVRSGEDCFYADLEKGGYWFVVALVSGMEGGTHDVDWVGMIVDVVDWKSASP
jgi:hypothetical protein